MRKTYYINYIFVCEPKKEKKSTEYFEKLLPQYLD